MRKHPVFLVSAADLTISLVKFGLKVSFFESYTVSTLIDIFTNKKMPLNSFVINLH